MGGHGHTAEGSAAARHALATLKLLAASGAGAAMGLVSVLPVLAAPPALGSSTGHSAFGHSHHAAVARPSPPHQAATLLGPAPAGPSTPAAPVPTLSTLIPGVVAALPVPVTSAVVPVAGRPGFLPPLLKGGDVQPGGEAGPVSDRFHSPAAAEAPLLAVLLPVIAGLLLLFGAVIFALRSRVRRDRERRALERAKSDFMMVASHELRTPLAIMRGYISMIRDGTLPPASAGYEAAIPVVDRQLSHVNDIVDHMLLATGLDAGDAAPLNLEVLDLRVIVQAAAARVMAAEGVTHTLQLDAPPSPVPVLADLPRLTEAVQELIDNAVKYSPAGRGVRCRVNHLDGVAEVAVDDDGFGIAVDDIPLLFTRFGRIVTSENSQILGLGLGLYLAREVTRLHGGDILVESAPGQGSTFTLRLPAADRT